MDYQIKGKLAFVTAGANGIGEAIANLLAQEGVGVIVADQDEAALKEKGGAWRATFAANLANAEGMDAAISHMVGVFGRLPTSCATIWAWRIRFRSRAFPTSSGPGQSI
jgi:NAD(P)-dependent dehydrogenase (short-subunit alcohol dehydrogenase family)